MGLIRLCGILLQLTPAAWLPSGGEATGVPDALHWNSVLGAPLTNGLVRGRAFGLPKASLRKVAGAHGRRGNQAGKRNAVTLILLFEIGEEEQLVFFDGPADRAAKLVELNFSVYGREETARIQIGVAEKLEDGAMERIGT